MKRIAVSVVALFLLSLASAAHAGSYTYTNVTTSGDASVHITQDISDSSHTTVTINGQTIVGPDNPTAPGPSAAPAALSSPRNALDALGAGAHSAESRVSQHIESHDGATTGSVRIYRSENGNVIEDRTVPLGNQASLQAAPAIIAAPQNAALPGIPHLAASTTLGRLAPLFGPSSTRIVATTTASGILSFVVQDPPSAIQVFISRILSLFGF